MKLTFTYIFVFILGLSITGFAQTKPAWLTSVENTIREKEVKLKIEKTEDRSSKIDFDFVINFNDFRSHIQMMKISRMDDTPENVFADEVDLYSQSFGNNSTKSKLKEYGDEGYIWANLNNEGWTRISFRKGKIFVNVFTSSEESAKRLAKYVSENLPED